ncbi:hypothetical protein GF362_04765 [Candidatus Dojkabacteria bacterium]|nr:hypothetical protein [Candidatus Dojkabacteria bacterium]
MNGYDTIIQFLLKEPIIGGLLVVAVFLGIYFIYLGFRVALLQRKIQKNQ